MRTFYQMAVWAPPALAVLVALLVHGLGLRPGIPVLLKATQLILAGLQYGGISYAALAIWATIWMRNRSEPEIRRLALRAPLLICAVYIPFALALGAFADNPLITGGGLAALGCAFILTVGYVYVGIVLAVRIWLMGADPDEGSAHVRSVGQVGG
jgi:hypothetical protein